MKNDPCIYAIISPSNKAYIGSTKHGRTRRAQHFRRLEIGTHTCTALIRAHAKYGSDGLVFVVLEDCCPESLVEREQWWFDNHGEAFAGLYNSSLIAGRVQMTDEIRRKISRTSKGRVVSDASRQKMSIAKKGYKHTELAKQRMSQAQAGKGVSGKAGIVWNKQAGKWEARVRDNGKRICIGRFDAIEGAVGARKKVLHIASNGGIVPRGKKPGPSGVKGVSWYAKGDKWRACAYIDGRKKHVGYFDTVDEAKSALDAHIKEVTQND